MLLTSMRAEGATGCDMVKEWIKMLKQRLNTTYQRQYK